MKFNAANFGESSTLEHPYRKDHSAHLTWKDSEISETRPCGTTATIIMMCRAMKADESRRVTGVFASILKSRDSDGKRKHQM